MMDLDLPVFKLTAVKRAFYYFLFFNVFVCVLSILLVAVTGDSLPGKEFVVNNTWFIMLALMALSFLFTGKSKKQLKAIVALPEFKDQVAKYERYYKQKLVWNGFSVVVSAFFFVMTNSNLFFYILVFQLLLSFAFYPRKNIITRELNNPGILFI